MPDKKPYNPADAATVFEALLNDPATRERAKSLIETVNQANRAKLEGGPGGLQGEGLTEGGAPNTEAAQLATELSEAPELPKDARLPDRHLQDLETAGRWFTEYLKFALEAAPRTPVEYHELFALSLGATAIARRVVLRVSVEEVFTNIYGLAIGPTSMVKKTTGRNIAERILHKADLLPFKLSDAVTPQSLTDELAGQRPKNFNDLPDDERSIIERGLLFAGQRSWLTEEAAQLFEAFNQEHLAALRNFILDLYDCPERRTYSTRGEGLRVIKRPYLTFCGPTTYASMRPHLKKDSNWNDGILARFILVTPATIPDYQFFPDKKEIPDTLAQSLKLLALDKLPMPSKDEPAKPLEVMLEDGVWKRWEAYDRALFALMADIPEKLRPNYDRLKMSVMKAAMIFATLDWATSENTRRKAPLITLKHYARAQQLGEQWRISLHRLLAIAERTQSEDEFTRIARILSPSEGRTLRELAQRLHASTRTEYQDLRNNLELMVSMGMAGKGERKRQRGPAAEAWYLIA